MEECWQASRVRGGRPARCFMENSQPDAFGALLPGGGAERISRLLLSEPAPRPGTEHGPPRTRSAPASCRAESLAASREAGLQGLVGPHREDRWALTRLGPAPALLFSQVSQPLTCHLSMQSSPATSLLPMNLCLLNTSQFLRKLFWVTDGLNVSEAFCLTSISPVKSSLC